MKGIFLFLTLVGVALSEQAGRDLKYFLYEDKDGNIKVEDLTATPNLTAAADDITYHFYSQRNPWVSIPIKCTDVTPLRNTAFSASKDTIFIIHGWKNTFESDVNSHIREDIIKGHDINIFVVDWSPVAGKNYVSAQGSVRKVGEFVGNFVNVLQQNFNVQLNSVKFVGHSLGAHVSGNAGAALNGRVNRITGLDPAGPLFTINNINNRLDPTDAQFVQAIHTNGGLLGFGDPLAHADYYPNGGKSQPGCGIDLTGSCAHSRAYAFYAESLNSIRFVSRKCDSYNSFTSGSCNNQPTSSMGMFNLDTRASGTYYLTTNSNSPYAKG